MVRRWDNWSIRLSVLVLIILRTMCRCRASCHFSFTATPPDSEPERQSGDNAGPTSGLETPGLGVSSRPSSKSRQKIKGAALHASIMTSVPKSLRESTCVYIQVSCEYKMRRRIFEPPCPTAQTEQARNLKFGMVGP